MKINITGASGFIGQHLVPYLTSNQYECLSISLRSSEWKMKIAQDAQAIIHLAGKAHDTTNTSDATEYFTVNRDLTIDLFSQFLTSDIQDFFYFSSVKAVADTVVDVLTEDVLSHPLTPYGQSKAEAEQYLLAQPLSQGKRLFIIRPCMIHGPGNKGNLNLLYKVVKKGIPWPLAAFENRRSFLSIDNLNVLLFQMLQNSSVPSGVYQVADDQGISTNELIEIMSKTMGRKTKLWRISAPLIKYLSRIGDVLHLPLNSERLKKLTESYVVSNQKIKTVLGIDKLPLSAEEGLIKTIQSFKTSNS